MSPAELEILLKARDEASRVMAQVDRNARNLGSNLQRFVRPAVLGFTAATTALTVVGGFLVRQAMEEEASIARLETALRNAGFTMDEHGTAKVETFVDSLSKFSGFADSDVRLAFATLVQFTGDAESAMSLLRLAVDVSRGSGEDLLTVSRDLGMAFQGNERSLRKYGIIVDENATREEVFAEVNEKYAGATSRWAETLEGRWEKLKNRFGEVADRLATAVVPIFDRLLTQLEEWTPAIEAGAEGLAKFIEQHPEAVKLGAALVGVAFGLKAIQLALSAGPIGLIVAGILILIANADKLRDAWDRVSAAAREALNIQNKSGLSGGPKGGYEVTSGHRIGDYVVTIGGHDPKLTGYQYAGSTALAPGGSVVFMNAKGDRITRSIVDAYRVGGAGTGSPAIPEYAEGLDAGPMPHDGLAFLHRGERVARPDQLGGLTVQVNVSGSVYADDLVERVQRVVNDTVRLGGFRGVLVSGRPA